MSGTGEKDEIVPESLADMKFWCTTDETRTKKAEQEVSAEMRGNVSAQNISQLFGDLMPAGGGISSMSLPSQPSSSQSLVSGTNLDALLQNLDVDNQEPANTVAAGESVSDLP